MSAGANKFKSEQLANSSLEKTWTQAMADKGHFFVKNGLFYHRDKVLDHKVQQLCLPENRIEEVYIWHMIHTTKELNEQKRICSNFYWEGMSKIIAEYVDKCHECQLKARAVVKDRVPISVIPRDQMPFSHLYIDVFGPLFDRTEYNSCLCFGSRTKGHPDTRPRDKRPLHLRAYLVGPT